MWPLNNQHNAACDFNSFHPSSIPQATFNSRAPPGRTDRYSMCCPYAPGGHGIQSRLHTIHAWLGNLYTWKYSRALHLGVWFR